MRKTEEPVEIGRFNLVDSATGTIAHGLNPNNPHGIIWTVMLNKGKKARSIYDAALAQWVESPSVWDTSDLCSMLDRFCKPGTFRCSGFWFDHDALLAALSALRLLDKSIPDDAKTIYGAITPGPVHILRIHVADAVVFVAGVRHHEVPHA